MIALAWVVLVLAGLAIAAYAYWVVLLSAYPEPIVADEVHTVATGDLWKIRLFHLKNRGGAGEPVLLVHGASMNRLLFYSPRGDSLGELLADRGYDVWAIDLRGRRSSEPPFGRKRTDAVFEDFVNEDLPAAVDYILKETGNAQLHWVGHSMGGMLSYAFARLHGQQRLASVCVLGSPLDFHATRFGPLRYSALLAVRAHGVAEVLLRGAAPLLRHTPFGGVVVPTHWTNIRPGVGTGFFFNAFEVSPPAVAEAMLRWGESQRWDVRDPEGREVDLHSGERLQAPLRAFYGRGDRLVDPDDAVEAGRLRASGPATFTVLGKDSGSAVDYGHLDLVIGEDAVKEVYEPLLEWLGAHPVSSEPSEGAPNESGENAEAAESGKKGASTSKSTARKKSTSKKKAGAGTKKPASKKKTAAKKKPVAKKKSSTKEKSPAKKKATPKKKASKKKTAAKKKPAASKKSSSSTGDSGGAGQGGQSGGGSDS